MPLYFESSPTTLGLYQKVGFELLQRSITHKAVDLGTPTDVDVPLMIRMPAAANGLTFEQWQAKGYPQFEGKTGEPSVLAAIGGDKLAEILASLTKACGGESNLIALASMASSIGMDKLPALIGLMSVSDPVPEAQAAKIEPAAAVKPTETITETTVEIAQL